MNTARVVSRTSVMLGIDGLHGGRPEIGLVSGRSLDTCSTNSEEKRSDSPCSRPVFFIEVIVDCGVSGETSNTEHWRTIRFGFVSVLNST